MPTLEDVLDAARRLPEADRRKLVAELESQSEEKQKAEAASKKAMQRWLERAGTGHSDFNDVSSKKNEHLAAIYATKP